MTTEKKPIDNLDEYLDFLEQYWDLFEYTYIPVKKIEYTNILI